MGKAAVIRRVKDRDSINKQPPIWEMVYDIHNNDESGLISDAIDEYRKNIPVAAESTYLTKSTLYKLLNVEPKIATLQSGIVPITLN